MTYHVLTIEECRRCREHEPDHFFKNCGYTLEEIENNIMKQTFHCTRCGNEWVNVWLKRKKENDENSIDN
jgi:DNA-directed RNA polymerase subunit M/transcription elongation factor TFIIS